LLTLFSVSDHGGCFFTPNSEYIGEACQYPAPFDRKYYPLTESNFQKYWRGGLTYWKFDNEIGRIDEENSFTMEFPPYTQDLTDMGKNACDGWSFTNSFCTEMYFGGIESGRPPFEAGCSSRDVDYLHVVNWKKAVELIKQGKYEIINGHKVIPIKTAVANNILFLVPEPKSPHGVDVSPDGKYIIVAGKLDSHAWVYSFEKIMKAIKDKNFEGHDKFGIPVISLETALHGSVEVGLGPLHNQFDDEYGIIYTSIYVDSRITKWNYIDLKVLDYVSSHYNVGHLVSAHGDAVDPRGKYLISLNKLSIDRFNPVGPLHPQNHQLIDIDADKMKVLYDLPIPMGEPHYTIMIDIDEYNTLSFMVDVNKLLVPTPPIYEVDDSTGQQVVDPSTGKPIILKGKDPDVSVVTGMVQSFYDAPGGFSEEMSEFSFAIGAEYWYDKQFALRAGFFYEDKTNIQNSLGVGRWTGSDPEGVTDSELDFDEATPSGDFTMFIIAKNSDAVKEAI